MADELIERCRRGDPLAWEALVRTYQGRVFGLATHYLHDPEEARDLAQEVFVQVYRQLARFEGDAFLPWLLRVARNLAIDRLRRREARPPARDLPADEVEIADGGASPERASEAEEAGRLVRRALGGMSEQDREILLLKEIQGLNFPEIAETLGIPVGTAKSRSHRARLALAERIVALDPSWGQS